MMNWGVDIINDTSLITVRLLVLESVCNTSMFHLAFKKVCQIFDKASRSCIMNKLLTERQVFMLDYINHAIWLLSFTSLNHKFSFIFYVNSFSKC